MRNIDFWEEKLALSVAKKAGLTLLRRDLCRDCARFSARFSGARPEFTRILRGALMLGVGHQDLAVAFQVTAQRIEQWAGGSVHPSRQVQRSVVRRIMEDLEDERCHSILNDITISGFDPTDPTSGSVMRETPPKRGNKTKLSRRKWEERYWGWVKAKRTQRRTAFKLKQIEARQAYYMARIEVLRSMTAWDHIRKGVAL